MRTFREMNLYTSMSLFFIVKQKTAYEMLRSLVGSEMCIRDRIERKDQPAVFHVIDIAADGIDAAQFELLFQLVERNQAGRVANKVKSKFLEGGNSVDTVPGGNIPVEHIIVKLSLIHI